MTAVISFSQNGHNDGDLLGIIDFHIGRQQPILQLGKHVTSRKLLFMTHSILGRDGNSGSLWGAGGVFQR